MDHYGAHKHPRVQTWLRGVWRVDQNPPRVPGQTYFADIAPARQAAPSKMFRPNPEMKPAFNILKAEQRRGQFNRERREGCRGEGEARRLLRAKALAGRVCSRVATLLNHRCSRAVSPFYWCRSRASQAFCPSIQSRTGDRLKKQSPLPVRSHISKKYFLLLNYCK